MALPVLTPWQRLDQLVDWERVARARMRVDLAPELDLLQRLGDPHRGLKVVHVTGSKGKGSVSAFIEAGLIHAGFRTGRYGSPHVVHVTERINLQGRPVEERRMETALERVLDARDAACAQGTAASQASWFDVVTAAAFCIFAEAAVDWAVIEVGLGGRLDSTNVVDPQLAVITNIGLEHTDVLGPTLSHVATEKAGIIKPSRPIVTCELPQSEAGMVIAEAARQRGSECTWVDARSCRGFVQANVALARTSLDLLGRLGVVSPHRGGALGHQDLPDETARQAQLPGRAERLQLPLTQAAPGAASLGQIQPPLNIVLDGAHVGFAITALLDELTQVPELQELPEVLLAISADKDARDIISRLKGRVRRVVCTELAPPSRCWTAEQLQAYCQEQGIAHEGRPSAEEALDLALASLFNTASDISNSPWLLVTGSLYLIKELRPLLMSRMAQPAATES
jgi:dihydrofolate synthase/folylpolyglutamate synthase